MLLQTGGMLGKQSPISASGLPLDTYDNTAVACSLRQLRSDYAGPAIRVRESGGDTEIDIGFDAGNTLDTQTLLAHCDDNDGFIVRWYDQSGNGRDAIQTDPAKQPKIVEAGTLITGQNTMPTLRFVASNSSHLVCTGIGDYEPFHIFLLCAPTQPVGTGQRMLSRRSITNSSLTNFILYLNSADGAIRFITTHGSAALDFLNSNSLAAANRFDLLEASFASGNKRLHQNNTLIGEKSGLANLDNSASNEACWLGGDPYDNGNFFDGKIQEMLIFDTDQTANRAAIADTINQHYQIF